MVLRQQHLEIFLGVMEETDEEFGPTYWEYISL